MPQGEISTETGWARKNAPAVVSLLLADQFLHLATIFRRPAGATGRALAWAFRTSLTSAFRVSHRSAIASPSVHPVTSVLSPRSTTPR